MFEIGRLCVKIAGRDAGKKCVVVDTLQSGYVLIDGETRRRKCNTAHLEPLDILIKIDKDAKGETIKTELERFGISIRNTNPKQKKIRPTKKRKTSEEIRLQKDERKKTKEILQKSIEEKGIEKKLETSIPEQKEEIKNPAI